MSLRRNIFVWLFVSCVFVTATGAQETSQSQDSSQLADGQMYVSETFRDWQVVCVKTQDAEHPCHIYQLIKDENGHPTAEITLVRVNAEEGISGAATVMTPLETLLTAELTLTLEENSSGSYPFSWCDKRGCYARIAFSDDDVFAMKRGRAGNLAIESITAPGHAIKLPISFLGFTDAFGTL